MTITSLEFRRPEPDLEPSAFIERARAMQEQLRMEQDATEERGSYSTETHDQFREAGFYRTLLPQRYGGQEFDVPTFVRMIIEVARGCPSTGWCLSLAAGHGLQLASLFPEQTQAEVLSGECDFAAPLRAIPMGTAKRVGDGWEIDGSWDYCSGAPFSSHAMVCVRMEGGGGSGAPMVGLALVPRSQWTLLDDWRHRAFGMRGSGSNTIQIENAVVPDHYVVEGNILATDFSGDTVGYRLHGNPMYAGHPAGYLQLEIGAVLVGTAQAALDEYERIVKEKKTTGPDAVLRYTTPDYQRYFGLALGKIDAAEDILIRSSQNYMEYCEAATREGSGFSGESLLRLHSRTHHAFNLAWDAVELLFRTSGTSEGARNGSRMQRYYRDYSTARTNIGLQYEPFATRIAAVHFGLESPRLA